MPHVSLHTLGCKLNYAETGTIAREFEARGYEVVPFDEPSDVTVINTCTVTSEAERKCRQAIRGAVRRNPETVVIVTGCYAQLRPDDMAAISGVDFVLGTAEKADIFRYVDVLAKQERTQVAVSCIDEVASFGPAFAAGERTRAFLKVQDGCDYSCSFCTIPKARGPSRSHTIDLAVRQAEAIAEAGYSEIVLSGVNIGLFGEDTGESLVDLLRSLDRVAGIQRYRISSIEPNLLTDQIVDMVAESRAFQPHFHIPLQSGDDEVLARMRRRYRSSVYAARVDRIRTVLPDAGIGADVIVGFPTETDAHFQRTVDFLEGLPISYLHAFTYSERPGTTIVEDGTPPLPKAERSRRNRVLRLLSEKKQTDFVRSQAGMERTVLWEEAGPDERLVGYTDNYVRVRRAMPGGVAGVSETVRIEESGSGGVFDTSDPALQVL